MQECNVGLVDVRRDGNLLAFAAPPTNRSGELEPDYLDRIVAAFGIDRSQVLAHQWIDNGPGWAVVRLATAQEVLDLDLGLSLIPEAMIGALGAYPDGSEHAYELRSFAPAVDVVEDPGVRVDERLCRPVARPHRRSRRPLPRLPGKQARPSRRDITISVDADGAVWGRRRDHHAVPRHGTGLTGGCRARLAALFGRNSHSDRIDASTRFTLAW
ncbi:hypothetical protein [Nocardia gipuzkoensis]